MRFCDGCGTTQPPKTIQIPLEIRNLANNVRRHQDITSVAVLFLATALTIFPLFTGDFTKNWGSIEAAYISDSIFISRNYPNMGWYPYWYGGLPFHLSYPPLFIYSVSLLHAFSGLSISHSYRILTAVAYSAAPAALYLIAKFLTKHTLPSFFAGLTYSFVPTFLPDPAPSHIGALTVFGEGPHIFGLALAFFALLLLLRYMAKPTWTRCLTTSILIASVALTNLVAFYALALLMVVAMLTEAIYKNDSAVLAFLLSGLIALGLIAFQYDLEFIRYSAQVSVATSGGVRYSVLLLLAPVFMVIFLRRYLNRPLIARANSRAWVFVSLWIIILGLIVIGRVWFRLPQLAPQPIRYVPEFDAGISLLLGLILTKVDKVSFNARVTPQVGFPSPRRAWVLGAFLVLLSVNLVFLLPLSLNETAPSVFISNVPEVRIANWLAMHVTDESVFATGSVAFWLNVFSNVRQLRGGSDQGATNTWWADVSYQILTGADPGTSVLWAQAWNIKYIVVTYPNASNGNLDYTYPHKFDNLLPLRYYFEGQGIYEIPLTRSALVQTISAESAESLTPITNALDIRDLAAYDYLTQVNPNSNATATYTYPNPDLMEVSVRGATFDTAILVKVTFDSRWAAEVNGGRVEVSRIGPDLMLVSPRTDGDYHLTLSLQHSDGETIGFYGTITTVILLIAISVNRFYPRLRSGPRMRSSRSPRHQTDLEDRDVQFPSRNASAETTGNNFTP